ncbi:hypothetical protein PG993_008992 [Apiospora rasikravindrae]|uniref:Uncharacterized protein n=1 Tax=Apiospora rasikravindrae TaxID=990691 RepID=A0ABR1SII7_9PEZI
MANVIHYLFPKQTDFGWNRPGAFDRAYGKAWGTGIDPSLPDRPEINKALAYIVEHPEIDDAFEEYRYDFLAAADANMGSFFPAFHEVEAFMNFLLDHEVLVDFIGIRDGDKKNKIKKDQWDHKAHVAAFILRMQRARMRDEKMNKLPQWGTGVHWCATHVLWELLYWKHTEWQRAFIAEHRDPHDPPPAKMYVAVAPGMGLQSYAPQAPLARLQSYVPGNPLPSLQSYVPSMPRNPLPGLSSLRRTLF